MTTPTTFPAAPAVHTSMPVTGPMVQSFPSPGKLVKAAMEALVSAAKALADGASDLRIEALPRPWDPATCQDAALRAELWAWLDEVACWINTQMLWNLTHPGIPECWPAHPHLVHELAVVACARHYTTYADSPMPLDAWHTNCLPGFLHRLDERHGGACQPGKHVPRPRADRDGKHGDFQAVRTRRQRFHDDVARVPGTPSEGV